MKFQMPQDETEEPQPLSKRSVPQGWQVYRNGWCSV